MAKKAFTEGKAWGVVDKYGKIIEIGAPGQKKNERYCAPGEGEKYVRLYVAIIKK